MENKKLGMIMIGLSIVFLIFLLYFSFNLNDKSDKMGCNANDECIGIAESLTITNFGFGFFGWLFLLSRAFTASIWSLSWLNHRLS